MAQKTGKELLAEKRAAALRENLKRRKNALHKDAPKKDPDKDKGTEKT